MMFYDEQVMRLQGLIKDREAGLGSVTSQVDSLRGVSERLQAELDTTQAQLREAQQNANKLQVRLNAGSRALHIMYMQTKA